MVPRFEAEVTGARRQQLKCISWLQVHISASWAFAKPTIDEISQIRVESHCFRGKLSHDPILRKRTVRDQDRSMISRGNVVARIPPSVRVPLRPPDKRMLPSWLVITELERDEPRFRVHPHDQV